jgi:hypothetical protein
LKLLKLTLGIGFRKKGEGTSVFGAAYVSDGHAKLKLSYFEIENFKGIAGTAGVPPANEREARKQIESYFERLRAFGAFAGGTPAVPANHLSDLLLSAANQPPCA